MICVFSLSNEKNCFLSLGKSAFPEMAAVCTADVSSGTGRQRGYAQEVDAASHARA